MKKILIIRFSSIGDIVLTSPVVRSLKEARPDWELHYATKAQYADLLQHNPHIDKLHLLDNSIADLLDVLKKEGIAHVLDLHHNLRSARMKLSLGTSSSTVDKQNIRKYLLTNFRQRDIVIPHIVQRYGETLSALDLSLDDKGLEFFIPPDAETRAQELWHAAGLEKKGNVLAVPLGAKHVTKRWLPEYFVECLNLLNRPVVLLGGKDTQSEAAFISERLLIPHLNVVATTDILTAAALMKRAQSVLTHDSGFMHIAAALKMKVYAIWGNTVPELGMAPYMTDHINIEEKGLDCRPCSKIGYDRCPKGHFRCMKEVLPADVAGLLRE